ncbi:hypothetical protein QEN58_09890 [Halomonas alkaliantarctica]|uniref:Uncharacterized protein n=1 Tax=Halomonas alkaliantarctica TaxID=232346 RepID=A0ABY8LGS8_9GAMM|nr:hypothetical protein [Halomonas alkaliantarctica]WGI23668.1 hypothetical protein QEN58_09890 [Halomonas alkaliantarctica]
MSRYAENTGVSSERSRAEIEQTVSRYGASGFMYGWDGGTAVMAFQMNGRRIRFDLSMPDRNSRDFTQTETGRERAPAQATKAWEQACRQRWRALSLVIKAKLEAVESGITEFEEEFLAHIVLPNGNTVGHWMLPQVESAYQSGDMPPLLPAPGKT